MSLLSDEELHDLITYGVINAPHSQVNGTSIDLTLHHLIKVESSMGLSNHPIDLYPVDGSPKQSILLDDLDMNTQVYPNLRIRTAYILRQDEFILGSTNETFNLPLDISCEYKLKSTQARNAMDHLNAGWCLTGDTQIPLLDGTSKPISELVESNPWVYSLNKDGEFVPAQASKVWKTKDVSETIVVTLDNGATFECTPEHKIMLRDGSYLEASKLSINQSLMPLYRKEGQYGHEKVYCPSTVLKSNWANFRGCWKYTHRIVNRIVNGEMQEGFDTHHIDHNKRNNEPSNLTRKEKVAHLTHHNRIKNVSEEHRAIVSKTMSETNKKSWQNPEYRAKMTISSSKIMIEANKTLWESDEHRAKMLPIQKANAKYMLETDQTLVQNSAKLGFLKKTIFLIVSSGESVSEETYLKFKRQNAPRIETFVNTFGSFNKALELAGYLNHKVAKIEYKQYDTPIPVYDMTIPIFHNFALNSGIFVHNCDAGWHGSSLTLELKNVSRYHKLIIRPGMPIGQMVFFRHKPVRHDQSYAVKGRYNNQKEVTESKGIRLGDELNV